MKGFLLDTNVLVALLWPSHAHHDRAVAWFSRHRARSWATCPITQAGFVRIVSNPAFSRDAVTPREAAAVLSSNTAAKDHAFWSDDLPFAEAARVAGLRLVGHQQITDVYLLGLALRHGGRLATLDHRIPLLTEAHTPERQAIEVIA